MPPHPLPPTPKTLTPIAPSPSPLTFVPGTALQDTVRAFTRHRVAVMRGSRERTSTLLDRSGAPPSYIPTLYPNSYIRTYIPTPPFSMGPYDPRSSTYCHPHKQAGSQPSSQRLDIQSATTATAPYRQQPSPSHPSYQTANRRKVITVGARAD